MKLPKFVDSSSSTVQMPEQIARIIRENLSGVTSTDPDIRAAQEDDLMRTAELIAADLCAHPPQPSVPLAAARAEIERLTKEKDYKQMVIEKLSGHIEKGEAERDDALAQVAVIIKEAVNICKDSEASTSDDPDGRMISAWFNDTAREIQALTPAHAQAALEAYGREKVREGMQRAADLVSHKAYGTAYWTILANMKKLK